MPIVIPDNYYSYRFIALDPGLNHTGVAIYEIDSLQRCISSIQAYTIHPDLLPNLSGLDPEYYNDRIIKQHKLYLELYSLIERVQPFAVVCESPFYNRFRPMAYGALLETLAYIQRAVLDYNPNIFFKTIEPLAVKKAVGAGMMKGKIDVKFCVENNPEIMSKMQTDIDLLDEHAIDSLAIGFCFIKNSGLLV